MERNVGTSDRFVLFVGKNLPRHTNLSAKMGNKKVSLLREFPLQTLGRCNLAPA